jgi:hypothetical protein
VCFEERIMAQALTLRLLALAAGRVFFVTLVMELADCALQGELYRI